jgi:hypothetical protein
MRYVEGANRCSIAKLETGQQIAFREHAWTVISVRLTPVKYREPSETKPKRTGKQEEQQTVARTGMIEAMTRAAAGGIHVIDPWVTAQKISNWVSLEIGRDGELETFHRLNNLCYTNCSTPTMRSVSAATNYGRARLYGNKTMTNTSHGNSKKPAFTARNL